MQEQEQTKTGETLVEYRRTTSPVSVRNTETENVSVNSSGEYDEFGGLRNPKRQPSQVVLSCLHKCPSPQAEHLSKH